MVRSTLPLAECIGRDFLACMTTGRYTDLAPKRLAELVEDPAALEDELVRNDQLLGAGHPQAERAAGALRVLVEKRAL